MLPVIPETSWVQNASTDNDLNCDHQFSSDRLVSSTMHTLAETITEGLREVSAQVSQTDNEVIITSLCKDLSQSVAELSVKLAYLSDVEALSDVTLECRKNLLDCATALTAALAKARSDCVVVGSEQKYVVAQVVFPLLSKGCLQALHIIEAVWMHDIVVSTGQPVVEMFNVLENHIHTKHNLFLNVKLFGMRLAKFLELVVVKTRDLRSDELRTALIAHSDTLHKIVPSLIQSLTGDGGDGGSRNSNTLLLTIGRSAAQKIIDCFSDPHKKISSAEEAASKMGCFVDQIDSVLKLLNEHWGEDPSKMTADHFPRLQALVDQVVQFALTVHKLMLAEDGGDDCEEANEVMNCCKHLVNEMETLKSEIDKVPFNPDTAILARQVIADFVEMLEQSVNSGILTLIATTFASAHGPLDAFILHATTSAAAAADDPAVTAKNEQRDRDFLDKLDTHHDMIFNIGHLATLCTPDRKVCQKIKSCLHLMESLEREMVPSVIHMSKCYSAQSPDLRQAKAHLQTIRKLWKKEVDTLEECLVEIVDPTAYCVVGKRLVVRIASKLKQSMYVQDVAYLRSLLTQLVKVSQRCVDFAWQAERSSRTKEDEDSSHPVDDSHPIVKMERSIWELKTATRLILANIADLQAHKSVLRRAQVLVSYLNELVQYLVRDEDEAGEEDQPEPPVRVLTSVSRITIGVDGHMTVQDKASSSSRRTNKTAGKSFRNVSVHGNVLVTDIELKPGLNATISRLQGGGGDGTAVTPFATRKTAANNKTLPETKPLSVPEEFDLSQILNKLSSLSHELSISLEQAKAEEKKKAKQLEASAAAKKRTPLKPVNGSRSNTTVVVASPAKKKNKQKIQLVSENTSKGNDQSVWKAKTKLDFSNPRQTESNRAKLEIEKYRSKVPDFLTEKEKAQEIEELDRKIAELMKS